MTATAVTAAPMTSTPMTSTSAISAGEHAEQTEHDNQNRVAQAIPGARTSETSTGGHEGSTSSRSLHR